MKKEEKELEIIVNGELDFRKMPKDIFDAFIAMLEDDICKWVEEERSKKAEEPQPKTDSQE